MKLLVNADLIDVDGALLDQVRAASDDLEVIVTTDAGRIEQVIPEVEVILGGIGPDLLPRAPNLRWVQSPAARRRRRPLSGICRQRRHPHQRQGFRRCAPRRARHGSAAGGHPGASAGRCAPSTGR